ncbi:phage major capsid protein, HK97 family [Sinosporangium album]|uniref:Phage major capsid protein, HK97 family n=1 Tax=Sinosporangium album TaxID=504805 RepID=A0A1G8EBS1_9ACTN|nr:phage major capsid protein [Sinosporangium album]SDH67366.1 phage major capsid protein, HK97 family [Sinosporangium album]
MTKTADIEKRIKELEGQLETKAAELNKISNAHFKDETGDGHLVISPEAHASYMSTLKDARDIKSLIAAQREHLGIEQYLDEPADTSYAARDAVAAASGRQHKSLSDAFLESEAYLEMKSGGFRQFGQVADFEQGLYSFERKDVFTLSGGTHTTHGFGTAEDVGLTERQLRPGRVRDLFPSEKTTSNILIGLRELGFVSNADVVPERQQPGGGPALGDVTDEFGMPNTSVTRFKPYKAPIVEVAHLQYVHKNTLADEARLRGILDRNMVDGIKMREDVEILYGTGDGDRITGLWNTPGVQTYTGETADAAIKSLQLRRAATRAMLAYYEATGVVLHPLDWEQIETERGTDGQYTIAISVAVGGEKRVWRQKVVDTTAITQGTFLTAAFGYGAKLYDRESVSVQASTEAGRAFEAGYVVLRGSERIGLVVDRPESIVLGTFAPTP